MNVTTLGDSKKYPHLVFLIEKIDSSPLNLRNYLSKFIAEFNLKIKEIEKIKDLKIFNYILHLVKNDYLERCNQIELRYPDFTGVSFLKNFLNARIKSLRNEREKNRN